MRPPAVSHNLKNCVKRRNENYWVFFQNFTEQYISYTMIQHQQIQILIDVFLVVVVFFLFFVLIYIDTTSISFFLRSLLSLLWKCAYIFWTSYFLKLYPFFLFKTFDFSSFFHQNKKQKEQKNINDVTYLFYLVHNDKLCVFVYVWLGVQYTVSYLTDIITKINVKKKVRF